MADSDIMQTVPAVTFLPGSGGMTRLDSTSLKSPLLTNSPRTSTAAFDGRDGKEYSPLDSQSWGLGRISSRPHSYIAGSKALLLIYRPLDPVIDLLDFDAFQVVSDKVDVNGTACILLQAPDTPSQGYSYELYLDPSRDFLPVRSTSTSHTAGDTLIVSRCDITYGPDVNGIPVPSSWQTAMINSAGLLAQSTLARVASAVLNQPIDDARFRIDFPPGTRINNKRDGGYYFVKPDRTLRKLRTFGEDPTVEPPAPGVKTGRRVKVPALIGVNVLVLSLVAIMMLRRRRASGKLESERHSEP